MTEQQCAAALARIAQWLAHSVGQHKRAIRKSFEQLKAKP